MGGGMGKSRAGVGRAILLCRGAVVGQTYSVISFMARSAMSAGVKPNSSLRRW